MDETPPTEAQVSMWMAMAEHFLDTETRHTIPASALCCLEAGCSVEQARHVWDRELAPVVSCNLWSVAGEWAGWDRDWLVARVQQRRRQKPDGPWNRLMRRWSFRSNAGVWKAIEGAMRLLEAAPVEERTRLTQDLEALARCYFDFCPTPFEQTHAASGRLQELREPFFALIEPATLKSERSAACERVEQALLRCRG